jgi:PAS domain S-box-containing protein
LSRDEAEAILHRLAGNGGAPAARRQLPAAAPGPRAPERPPEPRAAGATGPTAPATPRALLTADSLRDLPEALPDALVITDLDGRIVLVNAQTEQLCGHGREELLGRPIEVLMPDRYRERHVRYRADYAAAPHVRPMGKGLDLWGRSKDGREVPVEISLAPLQSPGGLAVVATILDVSTAWQREARLRKMEARYRSLVEGIPAVTFLASLDEGANELYVSPQVEVLLGYSQKEWLEDPVLWFSRLHPDDRVRWHEEFARTCARGDHFQSEYRFLSRDGAVVWVRGEARVVRDEQGRPLFLQGVAFDITAIKEAEEALRTSRDELERQVRQRTAEPAETAQALQVEVAAHRQANERLVAALAEQELLLKEIHHRVKNNLHIISSLLNLQAGQLTDPQARQVFRECQNRVRSMGLIHERLYRAKDLATIDAADYLNDLAASLFRSYGGSARGIVLRVNVRGASFDIDTAIPCGLIVNELVSNSLNYAFPGGRRGRSTST